MWREETLDGDALNLLVDVAAGGQDAGQTTEGQAASVVHARANGRVVTGAEVVACGGTGHPQAFNRTMLGIEDMK